MSFHKYVQYGLGVHSELPLWGAEEPNSPADVVVHWHRSDDPPTGAERSIRRAVSDGRIALFWPQIGEMLIDATTIVLHTARDAEASHVRHLVSGIGLGLVLHQRGVFALHASAVAIDGGAVVFVGPKGAGKSTLAAALAARGHALLSDDVAAIDLSDDAWPMVRQGPTNLNLWPDSAVATGHEPADLPRIWSKSSKRTGWLAAGRQADVPLRAVFVLTTIDGLPRVGERLPTLDAFSQLVGHTHAFRWVESSTLPHHLGQCRELLRRVPVLRAERGRSLDSLDVLVRQVEEHARSIDEAPASPGGAAVCA